MTISITTPDGIALARLITLRSCLRLEVETGLRATRHALVPIARQYGYTGRTKQGALDYINGLLAEFDAAREV